MLEVRIETENDAFEENKAAEVARILRDLASQIEEAGPDFAYAPLFDSNGNKCGHALTGKSHNLA